MLCKNLPKKVGFGGSWGGGVHEDLSYMADYLYSAIILNILLDEFKISDILIIILLNT